MAKILLVDDDPLESRMYQKLLDLENFEVDVAFNGEEGYAKAKAFKPDLILLDVMMPKMNGFELLGIFKSSDELRNTPIIMLTNLSGDENRQEAIKMGVALYEVKSDITNIDLITKIKDILNIYSKK
jgi:PleD family two-component response regulator